MVNMPNAVEMQAITKRFPGVVANDCASLSIRSGEIHALLGENGAGKTTLMNVLYGLYQPEGGRILVRGEPATMTGAARRPSSSGIGMVHQHFSAGAYSDRGREHHVGDAARSPHLLLDLSSSIEKGSRWRERQHSTGLALRAGRHWSSSPGSVGEQQRVEIAKALYLGAVSTC